MLKALMAILSFVSFVAVCAYLFVENEIWLKYWWQDLVEEQGQYTLIIGSSSIARMPNDLLSDCIPTKVYGFSNGTVEDLQKYLRFANLKNTKSVVIYIGENDIARKESYEVTFSQLQIFINTLQKKVNVPIAIAKLKFSPARQFAHDDFLKFNSLLVKFAEDTDMVELLPYDEIRDKTFYIRDMIHTNTAGTRKFARMINSFCRAT